MAAKIHNQQPASFFIKGILEGNVAVLSRAITLVESTNQQHQEQAAEILGELAHKAGASFRLGITGVPGVGKSTFIESFGKEVVTRGHKLAVLAVDPSSSISKGSILGDKTRMEVLSSMEHVYIRPSPSSGALGGVAKASYETILLCEAAGYDFIIVETVGVGQSEVAVSRITDFFLLLMLAGAGDELQGIKRGIMEMADSVVITKADGKNLEKAKAAKAEFSRALHFLQLPDSGFHPKVEICSSLENTGISETYDLILKYREFTAANGYFMKKRKDQQYELLLDAISDHLKKNFFAAADIQDQLNQLKTRNENEALLPFSTARKLVNRFFGK